MFLRIDKPKVVFQPFLGCVYRQLVDGKRRLVAFVGDGPLRADLGRRVVRTGLSGVVQLVGASPDVAGWLSRADILVRPSFTEGMPLAVLEGMASGVLVIASDVAGNTGLVRDGRNGLLFRAGDAAALAARLRFALGNPQVCRQLAAAGRDEARRYSWDACAGATLSVLRAAAAGPRWGPNLP